MAHKEAKVQEGQESPDTVTQELATIQNEAHWNAPRSSCPRQRQELTLLSACSKTQSSEWPQ
eukprot:6724303-Pyramimonas_sp.AAC.1